MDCSFRDLHGTPKCFTSACHSPTHGHIHPPMGGALEPHWELLGFSVLSNDTSACGQLEPSLIITVWLCCIFTAGKKKCVWYIKHSKTPPIHFKNLLPPERMVPEQKIIVIKKEKEKDLVSLSFTYSVKMQKCIILLLLRIRFSTLVIAPPSDKLM